MSEHSTKLPPTLQPKEGQPKEGKLEGGQPEGVQPAEVQAERVAVIADIHGNLAALEAVLADIARRGVERLVVNGDVVNRGPDSAAVLELLLGRSDTLFTLGNHDDLLRLWQARSGTLPPDWFDDPFWGATAWNARALEGAGLLDAPADWPLTLTLTPPTGEAALVAHGTADDYREGLSDRTGAARLRELTAGYGAVVGSHIHVPVQHRVGGAWVLNTGGVGVSADGDPRASYLLLTAGAGGWQPQLVRVPYDRQETLRRFDTSGYLTSGLSAEVFRAEIVAARSLYTPYWAWTEAEDLPRTSATWTQFLRRFS